MNCPIQFTSMKASQGSPLMSENLGSQAVVPPVRLAVDELVPRANKAMGSLDAAARNVSLEPALLELVRLRASQINGCAYCVDMNSGDARKGGESERRLHALAGEA